VGLEGTRVDVAIVETPDGHGRLELMKFLNPPGRREEASPLSPTRDTTSPRVKLCSQWQARFACVDMRLSTLIAQPRVPTQGVHGR
jgi:hypothetical protein